MKQSLSRRSFRGVRNGCRGSAGRSHRSRKRPTSRCCCAARSKPRRRMRAMSSSGTISPQSRQAAGGRIKTQLFESGQLFPDLQVGKALLQGQVEMAVPGTWSLTGVVPDADFVQLPALYGRPIDMVHRVVDGRTGQLLAGQIERRLSSHVIGPWLDLGFFNWFSTGKPLNSYRRSQGTEDPQQRRGGAGLADPVHGRDPEYHAVAERAARRSRRARSTG